MVCERCGAEMEKVGVLTENERNDVTFVNEKLNCAQIALNSNVIKDIKFTDGQVFEYFKASYDELAQAEYLRYIFYRDLKNRLGVDESVEVFIDYATKEVFQHPKVEDDKKEKSE